MIKLINQLFPIADAIRFPLLIVEWVFSFIYFEFGLSFFLRYYKNRKKSKTYYDLAFASFFIGFALLWFFFIIADYYSSEVIRSPYLLWSSGSDRSLILSFADFSIMGGALMCLYFMEKMKIFFIKRYFFTLCFLISIGIYFVLYFFILDLPRALIYPFYAIFILFLFLYFIDVIKTVKKKRILLIGAFIFIMGVILLFTGFTLTTDDLVIMYGFNIRLLGSIIQLASILCLFIFFLKIPPFSEFDFDPYIEGIFLINKGGIALYHKSFVESEDGKSGHLFSSGITSVNIILNEIISSQKKGLSIIKKKGKILYLYSGSLTTGVLICNSERDHISSFLKEFILRVEDIYLNILVDFDGDISIFRPVENIIKEVFGL
ncbi:MAG: membrane protein of unknown function [Promethearchaeota archaeon]|nr:MAG: membrane protein of unknown function [Candidatus Lokiarchaeota archaeon]